MEDVAVESRPELPTFHSSSSADEYAVNGQQEESFSDSDGISSKRFTPASTIVSTDEITPLTNSSTYGWTPSSSVRSSRQGSAAP